MWKGTNRKYEDRTRDSENEDKESEDKEYVFICLYVVWPLHPSLDLPILLWVWSIKTFMSNLYILNSVNIKELVDVLHLFNLSFLFVPHNIFTVTWSLSYKKNFPSNDFWPNVKIMKKQKFRKQINPLVFESVVWNFSDLTPP